MQGCAERRTSDEDEQDGKNPPRHDARTLMQGGTRAELVLDGQTYTLRITRQGKLILTK